MTTPIRVIDSHTEGEPTRVVISGAPDLGRGTVADRLRVFREQHDSFRSAIVCEPRGSDVLVGALLCESSDPSCATGVIFFNNVGYLGMCGHGAIGLVVTLAHLGRIGPGPLKIETPVGIVEAMWHGGGAVSVKNVPSRRHAANVTVEVPGLGEVTGDVAWGGNWFFLVPGHLFELSLPSVERLTNVAWAIRRALNAQGFPEVDHIELFGPPRAGGDARNFVLCPGGAYDRSPCGTGTSAKLACLAADGALREGEPWVQESIIGSKFSGSYQWLDRAAGTILPTVNGTAYITADSTLLLHDGDPFRHGIRAESESATAGPVG
jgi:4-hydroxyproline epimerase